MNPIFKHFLASIVLLAALSSCTGQGTYRSSEGGVWNTLYHITYKSPVDLSDSIISVMKQVEMSLSPFADSSLISRINRGERLPADSMLLTVFRASQQVNRQSHGAFDPTISPLINLWGFGYRTTGTEPTQEQIDSLMALVGIAECGVAEDGTLTLKNPATEFNFSAITKGYGCDMVGEMLRRNGCDDFMVEIGGEIAMSGRNSRGQKWHIQVDAPVESDTSVIHQSLALIEVTDCGVATSGNYRNFKLTPDGKVWHTISTVTGRPAETDVLSATVIAPSAMLADAFATSCMAMPAEEAIEMIEAVEGVDCLLVKKNGIITSKGFPKLRR